MSKESKGSRVVFSGEPKDVAQGFQDLAAHAGSALAGKGSEEEQDIGQLLSNSKLNVIASRVDPPYPAKVFVPQDGIHKTLVSEAEFPTPTTITEIKKMIEATYGGKRWFVGVFDPEKGDESSAKVGGTYINIKANPKMVFMEEDELPYQGQPPNYALQGQTPFDPFTGQPRHGVHPGMGPTINLDSYDDDDDETHKETPAEKVERMTAELEMQRKQEEFDEERRMRREERRGSGDDKLRSMMVDTFTTVILPKISEISIEMDRKFKDLEKEFTRDLSDLKAKVETTQTTVDGKLDRAMTDLKGEMKELQHKSDMEKMEAKNSQERALVEMRGGIDRVKDALSTGFSEMRTGLAAAKDGKGMAEIMATMQQTSQGAITSLTGDIIKAMSSKTDGQDSITKTVEAFAMLQSAMNPQEGPKDALTLAAEAVKEAIPEVSGYLKARMEAGREITSEVVSEKIDEAIGKIAPDITGTLQDTVKKEIAKRIGGSGLVPKKIATKPQPATTKQPGQAPAPGAQPAKTTQPAPKSEKSEEEIKAENIAKVKAQIAQRVNGFLTVVLEEIDVMPGEAQFIGYALNYLPKEMLKKFISVEGPADVAMILSEYASEDLIGKLREKLIASEEMRTWVGTNLQALFGEIEASEIAKVAQETPLETPADTKVEEPVPTDAGTSDVSEAGNEEPPAATEDSPVEPVMD
jgi:hypothetical protein